MHSLYKYMAIPETCLINKWLFKKLFQERPNLDITDKKALKDDVDKIHWVYTLKPATINISAYYDESREYVEIAIIQIDLISINRTQRIAEFVHKAIPYPVMIMFTFADTISISVADKRVNQVDKSKSVIESTWMTSWFNPDSPNESQQKFMLDMAINNLSFINFYAFYTDIKDRIIALNAADKTGYYSLTTGNDTINRLNVLQELNNLGQEKAELMNKQNKEKQMGQQIEMNNKLKKIADKMNDLKNNL